MATVSITSEALDRLPADERYQVIWKELCGRVKKGNMRLLSDLDFAVGERLVDVAGRRNPLVGWR